MHDMAANLLTPVLINTTTEKPHHSSFNFKNIRMKRFLTIQEIETVTAC